MKTLSDFKFSDCILWYGVANTPEYLLRKLSADKEVQQIAQVLDPESIYYEIKKTIRKKPKNLYEGVLPYALLVALAFVPKSSNYIIKASKLKAKSFEWYRVLADMLLEKSRPAVTNTFAVRKPISIQRTAAEQSEIKNNFEQTSFGSKI